MRLDVRVAIGGRIGSIGRATSAGRGSGAAAALGGGRGLLLAVLLLLLLVVRRATRTRMTTSVCVPRSNWSCSLANFYRSNVCARGPRTAFSSIDESDGLGRSAHWVVQSNFHVPIDCCAAAAQPPPPPKKPPLGP